MAAPGDRIGTMTLSCSRIFRYLRSRRADRRGLDNVLAGDPATMRSPSARHRQLYGDGRIIALSTARHSARSPPIRHRSRFPGSEFVDGDDVLAGGDGNDSLWGGGGTDTASYAGSGGQQFVSLASGFSSGAAGDDDLHSIENVIGSAFDDQLFGNSGANALTGGDGHDYMRGILGNDTLSGGGGDDYLGGGFGDDVLNGGAGWDRVAFYHDTATA